LMKVSFCGPPRGHDHEDREVSTSVGDESIQEVGVGRWSEE
jgi:hypothetical protein